MNNFPNPVDRAGKAMGGFFIIVGWIVGMFLLFNSPMSILGTVALIAVEIAFYVVGLIILIIFSEEG